MNNGRISVKSGLIFFFKLTGAVIFLTWAFSQIENKVEFFSCVKRALATPHLLVTGIALGGISIFASVYRLYYLLKVQPLNYGRAELVKIILLESFFNLASLGVIFGVGVKLVCLIQKYPEHKLRLALVLMMDSLIGFISVGIIFIGFSIGGGFFESIQNETLRTIFFWSLLLQFIGMISIVGLFFLASDRGVDFIMRRHPKLSHKEHFKNFWSCLNLYRKNFWATIKALIASLILTASYFVAFYVAVLILGDNVPINTVISIMPLVDFVSSIPISISGLGVREKSFEYLMSDLTTLSKAEAVSASLIGFFFHVFWALIGGCVFVIGKFNTKNISKVRDV